MLFAAAPAHAQGSAELAPPLRGMDVVGYFQPAGPVLGQPAFNHDFDGARYRFANEKNKAAFVADPDRYLPHSTDCA